MPDFVKQRGADFRTENRGVALCEIPEIFQPKPDARSWRFRCALVIKPQRVGLNPVGDVLGIRLSLEENGNTFSPRREFPSEDLGAQSELPPAPSSKASSDSFRLLRWHKSCVRLLITNA